MSYKDSQLLCSFTTEEALEQTISDVVDTYVLAQDLIFVLENRDDPSEVFCTYNVDTAETDTYLEDTISIHRNQSTNTLYTINALNAVIVELNGELDKTFDVPWDEFRNRILVKEEGALKQIPTVLGDILKTQDLQKYRG